MTEKNKADSPANNHSPSVQDKASDLVCFEGLTKHYQQVRALDDISLRIQGGITGLLGPNGAGKTTLIKAMLGLLRITGGQGTVLGFRLGEETEAIRERIGYMPEDDCYVAGLSGVEMVRLMARLAGLPSVEALRRSHEILDFCGAQQERYRPIESYSTGMRQKLKFAQAIVHDPDFLVLDEPTSGLDPEERQAMLNRIRLLATRAGKAVLLSTHILMDVQEICDTVIILVGGRVRLVEQMEKLRQPATPAYHLRLLGEGAPLVQKLQEAGHPPRQEDDGTLTLEEGGDAFPEKIWRWAEECDVGIRLLSPAQNSLEQIFLQAVKEEDKAPLSTGPVERLR